MRDYSKGRIYTIRCKTDDTLIYVGSTVQPLCERLAQHKRSSRNEKYKNWLIYKTINGDWNNWHIELHSLYPCNSKEELERKEGEIIRLIGNLNMVIAGRTHKEYCEVNKDKLKANREVKKEEKKKYDEVKYEKNKEAKIARNKAYNEANKEKIKAYNEANKEARKAYNKAYYEKTKQLKNNIPIIIECQ